MWTFKKKKTTEREISTSIAPSEMVKAIARNIRNNPSEWKFGSNPTYNFTSLQTKTIQVNIKQNKVDYKLTISSIINNKSSASWKVSDKDSSIINASLIELKSHNEKIKYKEKLNIEKQILNELSEPS